MSEELPPIKCTGDFPKVPEKPITYTVSIENLEEIKALVADMVRRGVAPDSPQIEEAIRYHIRIKVS